MQKRNQYQRRFWDNLNLAYSDNYFIFKKSNSLTAGQWFDGESQK